MPFQPLLLVNRAKSDPIEDGEYIESCKNNFRVLYSHNLNKIC